ncbi:hypothetical protein H6F74_01135 [Trichocoleus sp. FACHB-90]|uniref:hypothetical protein n=1 Tax=Cyanophyceae TaxID=3028117 RepID=UPI00168754EC|nr:hypothetical protein [Trichocoleus sp. FACHB-90]MBD1924892.1 hypothetical protein [Trichocoleus sp. FACHB-90]
MKIASLLSTILVLFLLLLGFRNQFAERRFTAESSGQCAALPTTSREAVLWEKVMQPMLHEPLWRERDAYDASHFLMVPLHSAFASNYCPGIDGFNNFFNRFRNSYIRDNFNGLDSITKLQFLYLVSEYLVLYEEKNNHFNKDTLRKVLNSLEVTWKQPTSAWDKFWFRQGMKERIMWKLSTKSVEKSYYRSFTDEELFVFAIAADLKSILLNNSPKFIDEILDVAYKTLKQEAVFIGANASRWLFQPGVWKDHPDYAYAGWYHQAINLDKKPIPGIAGDSSHSHRWPLWLVSLQRGFKAQKQLEKVEYILKLRRGLAAQFIQKVLIPPSSAFPNFRTTNFMDGNNGIYRYGYHTDKTMLGYGSYELSGTMLIGWWAFLPEKSMQKPYCFIGSRYPLTDREISLYLNHDTTRDRHPFIKGKAQYKSGILELIARLACKLPREKYQ